MNGKRAKELRKMSRLPDLPDKEYKDIKHRKPWGEVRVTTVLVPHCRRSWYKAMKKGYTYGQH